jgi:hypothetical protein
MMMRHGRDAEITQDGRKRTRRRRRAVTRNASCERRGVTIKAETAAEAVGGLLTCVLQLLRHALHICISPESAAIMIDVIAVVACGWGRGSSVLVHSQPMPMIGHIRPYGRKLVQSLAI